MARKKEAHAAIRKVLQQKRRTWLGRNFSARKRAGGSRARIVTDAADVLDVFGFVSTIDQDVVKIYNHITVQKRAEGVVDQFLKGGGRIGQSQRHHEVLVQAPARFEDRFPLVAFGDADKIVGASQVDFRKDFGALQLVEVIGNER